MSDQTKRTHTPGMTPEEINAAVAWIKSHPADARLLGLIGGPWNHTK